MEEKIMRYALRYAKDRWLEADEYAIHKKDVYKSKPNPVNMEKMNDAIEKAEYWWNEFKAIKAEMEEIA